MLSICNHSMQFHECLFGIIFSVFGRIHEAVIVSDKGDGRVDGGFVEDDRCDDGGFAE